LKKYFLRLFSHLRKKYIENKKKIKDVIRSFAHIEVYLKAGIKNITDDKIQLILLGIFLNFNLRQQKKSNGKITDKQQKKSLKKNGL
jgi:hypothetical protein